MRRNGQGLRQACALVALTIAFAGLVATDSSGAATLPEARAFSGVSTVGALFTLTNGAIGRHFCSASVVTSPKGDLVITAAHCVSGRSAASIVFVPGYDQDAVPLGVWTVDHIYLDRAWSAKEDPDDDFAFLAVSRPESIASIESVAGSERLVLAASPNQLLRVIGYPDDLNSPITCTNVGLSFSATQIEFDCGGYTIGTSGGPMLLRESGSAPEVIGVIGGYQQGGDTPAVSYAAKFRSDLASLYREAALS